MLDLTNFPFGFEPAAARIAAFLPQLLVRLFSHHAAYVAASHVDLDVCFFASVVEHKYSLTLTDLSTLPLFSHSSSLSSSFRLSLLSSTQPASSTLTFTLFT